MKLHGEIKVYVKRQRHLVVCSLDPSFDWVWTSCAEMVHKFIGRTLELGESVRVTLRAYDVKKVRGKKSNGPSKSK